MRPAGLPRVEAYAHGTRGRYTNGCRCDLCKKSNRDFANNRVIAIREAAKNIKPNRKMPVYKILYRTSRNGNKYQAKGRVCPGTGGRPCVSLGAWLRAGFKVCIKCIDRATVWNGLVGVTKVHNKLARLSKLGVGYRSVADTADVSRTILVGIISGKRKKIRAAAERRILAVDAGAAADHALVSAAPTWKLLDNLTIHGFSHAWISRELGYKSGHQYNKRQITIRNAWRVEQLHRRVVGDKIKPPPVNTRWSRRLRPIRKERQHGPKRL